jgi:MFS family permease
MHRGNLRTLGPYFVAFLSGDVAVQIQGIAVAWHVFTLHHRPFDLGLVGLTLFLPAVLLVLVTGLYADRHDRRAIVIGGAAAETLATLAFLAPAMKGVTTLWPYLTTLLALGTGRAFAAPAERGLLIALVREADYMRVTAAYSATRAIRSAGRPWAARSSPWGRRWRSGRRPGSCCSASPG